MKKKVGPPEYPSGEGNKKKKSRLGRRWHEERNKKPRLKYREGADPSSAWEREKAPSITN